MRREGMGRKEKRREEMRREGMGREEKGWEMKRREGMGWEEKRSEEKEWEGQRRDEKRRKEKGTSEGRYILGGEQKNVATLKVPRQLPLVLLVRVRLKQGKALEREGNELEIDFVTSRRNKSSLGFTAHDRN
jgi:hypothetical protein